MSLRFNPLRAPPSKYLAALGGSVSNVSPPLFVAATAIGLYLASAPLGHLVEREITALFAPRYVFVPMPAPTTQATPTTPETTPSPVAGALSPSAGGTKRAAPIEYAKPEAPEPEPVPTVISGPASPPVVVLPPVVIPSGPVIVGGSAAPAAPAPARPPGARAPRNGDADAMPRPAPEHARRAITRELPGNDEREELPSRELPHDFLRRVPGGFSGFNHGGFAHRLGPPFSGGFTLMRRPMPGGFFRPRLSFGGFGHFHLF